MKKLFLILFIAAFAIVVVFIFVNVFESTTRQKVNNNADVKIALLEGTFRGQADFTSAVYVSYSLGCRPANTTELLNWAAEQKELPERIYLLEFVNLDDEKHVMFLRNDTLRLEKVSESTAYLNEQGKIYFLAVKDAAMIQELYAGEDPAPDFGN